MVSNSTEVRPAMGLDLSDKSLHFCLLDCSGKLQEEGKIPLKPDRLRGLLEQAGEPLSVFLEVGTHSPWVSRLIEELGHEAIVANPREPVIAKKHKKTDRIDAEHLARIGRSDRKLLAPIRHRGNRTRENLAVLRARDVLVRARARLVNHIKGSVKPFGARIPSGYTAGFHKKAAQHIPQELLPALTPLIDTIANLTSQILEYEVSIERLCEVNYPETKVLRQVPGIGPLTALSFMLILEDHSRFSKSRDVGSYVGLVPKQWDSGKSEPQLRISKAGDKFLRRLLVGSSQYILGPFGPDTDLRRWGLKLAERGGKNAKRRAVVAVARKLAVLLHSLWRSGEIYEPLRWAKN